MPMLSLRPRTKGFDPPLTLSALEPIRLLNQIAVPEKNRLRALRASLFTAITQTANTFTTSSRKAQTSGTTSQPPASLVPMIRPRMSSDASPDGNHSGERRATHPGPNTQVRLDGMEFTTSSTNPEPEGHPPPATPLGAHMGDFSGFATYGNQPITPAAMYGPPSGNSRQAGVTAMLPPLPQNGAFFSMTDMFGLPTPQALFDEWRTANQQWTPQGSTSTAIPTSAFQDSQQSSQPSNQLSAIMASEEAYDRVVAETPDILNLAPPGYYNMLPKTPTPQYRGRPSTSKSTTSSTVVGIDAAMDNRSAYDSVLTSHPPDGSRTNEYHMLGSVEGPPGAPFYITMAQFQALMQSRDPNRPAKWEPSEKNQLIEFWVGPRASDRIFELSLVVKSNPRSDTNLPREWFHLSTNIFFGGRKPLLLLRTWLFFPTHYLALVGVAQKTAGVAIDSPAWDMIKGIEAYIERMPQHKQISERMQVSDVLLWIFGGEDSWAEAITQNPLLRSIPHSRGTKSFHSEGSIPQAGPSSLPIFPSGSSASTFESWAQGSERAFEGYATAVPPAPASAPPAPAPASAPASVHVPPAPASANPGRQEKVEV
ncbi:hypothetical protein FRC12_008425 [Ceratobasidium sp. 428]|nr:hypothetical protein FRC12_008425 [Ceratobasidium sp. 428]